MTICHICKKEQDWYDWQSHKTHLALEKKTIQDDLIHTDQYDNKRKLIFCDDCWNKIVLAIPIIMLKDSYIIQNIMLRFKLKRKNIKAYPELIKSYREQIRIKRLLKSKKHENIKTS